MHDRLMTFYFKTNIRKCGSATCQSPLTFSAPFAVEGLLFASFGLFWARDLDTNYCCVNASRLQRLH